MSDPSAIERPSAAFIPPPARRWITFAVALWVLNLALTFHNVWPTLWIETRHELSIEIAVLLLGIAGWSELRRPPSARVVTVLAAILVLMCVGRYAEVTAPALYGRPVNLYWDAQHLPNVAAMLAKVANPWLIAAGTIGILGLVLGLFAALRWALARVVGGLAAPVERRALAGISSALVVLFALGHTSFPLRTLGWFSLPVTGTYKQQVEFLAAALIEERSGRVLPPPVEFGEFELTRLAAALPAADEGEAGPVPAPAVRDEGEARLADVWVVFLESYGATSYDTESMSTALAESRARFAEAVEESGRGAVSAFVESPTFGGASWLAHASFMTGLHIDHSGAYELLLTQRRDTLPRRFKRAGFRSIALMPGLRQGWPEGAFYGFDEIYGERKLAYRGPEFGWWRIPDQYALAKFDALEVEPALRSPLMVFFPTISTHIPFRPTPPYQPDWPRLETTRPYDAEDVERSLASGPEWLNLVPAYVDSLRYTYDYWSGYLGVRRDSDFVLIMLGDHQPVASVTGEDARWDVPVHVIASRPQILDDLERAGFTRGTAPEGESIAPMHELAPLLLEAFAGSAVVSRAVPR